jgi:hypothetical protein
MARVLCEFSPNLIIATDEVNGASWAALRLAILYDRASIAYFVRCEQVSMRRACIPSRPRNESSNSSRKFDRDDKPIRSRLYFLRFKSADEKYQESPPVLRRSQGSSRSICKPVGSVRETGLLNGDGLDDLVLIDRDSLLLPVTHIVRERFGASHDLICALIETAKFGISPISRKLSLGNSAANAKGGMFFGIFGFFSHTLKYFSFTTDIVRDVAAGGGEVGTPSGTRVGESAGIDASHARQWRSGVSVQNPGHGRSPDGAGSAPSRSFA